MSDHSARYCVGQVVRHKMFDYRGVIYDVDAVFQGDEVWYQGVARSRPPKNRPWYRVIVDHEDAETYVAERNLEADDSGLPVSHPELDLLFAGFEAGRYQARLVLN